MNTAAPDPVVIPRPPREAATVVLGRDARDGSHGFEVYLVRRPQRAGFMPDSHVFPGGKVESSDAEVAAGVPADAVAAAREAFEECAILLAVDANGHPPDTGAARFVEHRSALHAGTRSFADILHIEGLRLDAGGIARWAHWITPSGEPVRFSARFFVARVPPNQEARHAEGELVDDLWAPPADALARETRSEIRLPPPTYFLLHELAAFGTWDAVTRAAATRQVVTILPKLFERDGHTLILLPWDREYAASPGEALPIPADFTPPPWSRHVLDGGRWWRRT